MAALLEKAGLVNDQHPLWRSQMRHHIAAQIVPHRFGIPHSAPQQMLYPVGRDIAIDFGQLPAIFALDWAEQPPQIGPHTPPRVPAGKPRTNPLLHLGQFQEPRPYGVDSKDLG
jgi:hypothetical protein